MFVHWIHGCRGWGLKIIPTREFNQNQMGVGPRYWKILKPLQMTGGYSMGWEPSCTLGCNLEDKQRKRTGSDLLALLGSQVTSLGKGPWDKALTQTCKPVTLHSWPFPQISRRCTAVSSSQLQKIQGWGAGKCPGRLSTAWPELQKAAAADPGHSG